MWYKIDNEEFPVRVVCGRDDGLVSMRHHDYQHVILSTQIP